MKKPKKLTYSQEDSVSANNLNPKEWLLVDKTLLYLRICNKRTEKIKIIKRFPARLIVKDLLITMAMIMIVFSWWLFPLIDELYVHQTPADVPQQNIQMEQQVIFEPEETTLASLVVSETEAVSEKNPETEYLNIPFDCDMQDKIKTISSEYGIEYELVLAIIEVESNYTVDCIGDNGNSLGLMQIQPRWWGKVMSAIGTSDLLNGVENVETGCAILKCLYLQNNDTRKVLNAYNTGSFDTENGYSSRVLAAYERLVSENEN